MPAQALAALATLVSFAPHGNRIDLQLDRGAAELVWVSPSTFRFRRTLDGKLPLVDSKDTDPVRLEIDDTPGAVRLRSKFLEVTIEKHGLRLRVRRADGAPLMADLSEPVAVAGGFEWERQVREGARFYGLGPRVDPAFDLRGTQRQTRVPFLLTTAGYGEYHVSAGSYGFDFRAQDRYRIHAPAIDYFFYYGPMPKQILEEHKRVRGPVEIWPVEQDGVATWETLRAALLRIVQGGISGLLAPAFDLAAYAKAPAELQLRARQMGSLVAEVSPGAVGLSSFRGQLDSFFTVYDQEMHDKGYPIWHPLPFQFPEDPDCALHADEFMLGDEMLVAPIYDATGRRAVYLPQGVWTNLETNEAMAGRRTITVETKSLPVFARNGAIVPLDSAGGIALHYFPKLAAEFFLLESEAAAWTQVHAAPAADIMRLQIEANKTREYELVVHHVERPAEVGFEGSKFREAKSATGMADRTWFYDAARKNLQVRLRVAAGEDAIVNIGW